MVYVLKSGLQNDGKCEPTNMMGQQTAGELWIVPIGGTGKSQSSQLLSFGPTGTFDDDGSIVTAGIWLLCSGISVKIAGRSNYRGCEMGKGKGTDVLYLHSESSYVS